MSDIGHSGLCMICGKPINIVPVLISFPDIFLCPECEKKASDAKENGVTVKRRIRNDTSIHGNKDKRVGE